MEPKEGNWALKTFVPMPVLRWMKLLTINNAQWGGTFLQLMTSSFSHALSTLQYFPLLMSTAEFLFLTHLCVVSSLARTVSLTWARGLHCEALSLGDR